MHALRGRAAAARLADILDCLEHMEDDYEPRELVLIMVRDLSYMIEADNLGIHSIYRAPYLAELPYRQAVPSCSVCHARASAITTSLQILTAQSGIKSIDDRPLIDRIAMVVALLISEGEHLRRSRVMPDTVFVREEYLRREWGRWGR